MSNTKTRKLAAGVAATALAAMLAISAAIPAFAGNAISYENRDKPFADATIHIPYGSLGQSKLDPSRDIEINNSNFAFTQNGYGGAAASTNPLWTIIYKGNRNITGETKFTGTSGKPLFKITWRNVAYKEGYGDQKFDVSIVFDAITINVPKVTMPGMAAIPTQNDYQAKAYNEHAIGGEILTITSTSPAVSSMAPIYGTLEDFNAEKNAWDVYNASQKTLADAQELLSWKNGRAGCKTEFHVEVAAPTEAGDSIAIRFDDIDQAGRLNSDSNIFAVNTTEPDGVDHFADAPNGDSYYQRNYCESINIDMQRYGSQVDVYPHDPSWVIRRTAPSGHATEGMTQWAPTGNTSHYPEMFNAGVSFNTTATTSSDTFKSIPFVWTGSECATTIGLMSNSFYIPAEWRPEPTKQIKDGSLAKGQFTFTMTPAEGAPGQIQSKTNEADGTIGFDYVKFDEDSVGTWKYTVREIAGSDEAIEYDTHETVYTVKATKNSSTHMIDLSVTRTGSETFVNSAAKGNFTITKVDMDTLLSEPQGNAALIGAQFGVYTDAACTNRVSTVTIGSDLKGKAADQLPLSGNPYYLKEIKAPTGYKLNTEVITINAHK